MGSRGSGRREAEIKSRVSESFSKFMHKDTA